MSLSSDMPRSVNITAPQALTRLRAPSGRLPKSKAEGEQCQRREGEECVTVVLLGLGGKKIPAACHWPMRKPQRRSLESPPALRYEGQLCRTRSVGLHPAKHG